MMRETWKSNEESLDAFEKDYFILPDVFMTELHNCENKTRLV
jgi:hypothetical protein